MASANLGTGMGRLTVPVAMSTGFTTLAPVRRLVMVTTRAVSAGATGPDRPDGPPAVGPEPRVREPPVPEPPVTAATMSRTTAATMSAVPTTSSTGRRRRRRPVPVPAADPPVPGRGGDHGAGCWPGHWGVAG